MATDGIAFTAKTAALGAGQGALAGMAGGVAAGAIAGLLIKAPGMSGLSPVARMAAVAVGGALVGAIGGGIGGALIGGNPTPNSEYSRSDRATASGFVLSGLGAGAAAAIPLTAAVAMLATGNRTKSAQFAKVGGALALAGLIDGGVAGALGGYMQMGTHYAIVRESH